MPGTTATLWMDSLGAEPKLVWLQLGSVSVLRYTRPDVPAYTTLGRAKSTSKENTTSGRPLLAGLQVLPPSVLRNTPFNGLIAAYTIVGVTGCTSRTCTYPPLSPLP